MTNRGAIAQARHDRSFAMGAIITFAVACVLIGLMGCTSPPAADQCFARILTGPCPQAPAQP